MTGPGFDQLSPGVVVRGPLFPEPVEVITTIPMGESVSVIRSPAVEVEEL